MHLERAHYQAMIWRQADTPLPKLPSPEHHGWEKSNGQLQVKWTKENLMPEEHLDVILETPLETLLDTENESPDTDNFKDVVFSDEDKNNS